MANPFNDTNLVMMRCGSTGDANRLFGTRSGNNVPLVIIPGKPLRPWMCVPEGMYALVLRSGENLDHPVTGACWPAGYHAGGFLTNVDYLVTKQNIVFDTPVKGCPTADNVIVQIDTCIVFRIMGDREGEDSDLVRKFVYELGPTSLTQQLKDSQEEAIRNLARSKLHTEVYSLSGESCDSMQRDLNEQFNCFGVSIVDVAITNVSLPISIRSEMQQKTMAQSEQEEQIMKQKYLSTEMNLKESLDLLTQDCEDSRLAEKEKFERLNAEIIGEREEIEAATAKQLRMITETMKADVLLISERGKAEKLAFDVERDAILKQKNAEACAMSEQLVAEKDAWVDKSLAVGGANVVNFEAMAFQAVSNAEGKVAPMIRERREYELELERVHIYNNLSRNQNVAISGITDNSLLAEILTNNSQSNVLLGLDKLNTTLNENRSSTARK